MTEELILEKLKLLTEPLKRQTLDYIEFLLVKHAVHEVPQKKRGGLGSMKGTFTMSDDFDAPLEDFKEYM